ncbi:hypothetical protein CVT24_009231 [Panaeolus cyanescens]|uniref:cutinase n=1 Tax=Panaeolus cyanescens TaxID=181874 RepID=A0A409Y7Z8_9AGAR|nr:hypothetical protein CVT24_009231 [Panaeolus cyanescens]
MSTALSHLNPVATYEAFIMYHALNLISFLAIAVTSIIPAIASHVELRLLNCPDVAVFFARGTTEIPTIGTSVGPPFSAALTAALPGKHVVFKGINYPAAVVGLITGGDIGGGVSMANNVSSTVSECPGTKIVMSGFEQGALVTHLAINQLLSSIQDHVTAVVTFGDPRKDVILPGVLQSRRKTFCFHADPICAGQLPILPPYNYGADTPAAAAYVAAHV